MVLPVFIMPHHLREIEQYLIDGGKELDYSYCEGIDPSIYGVYKALLENHQEQTGKIKERNVSKRLKKIIKKLEYSK